MEKSITKIELLSSVWKIKLNISSTENWVSFGYLYVVVIALFKTRSYFSRVRADFKSDNYFILHNTKRTYFQVNLTNYSEDCLIEQWKFYTENWTGHHIESSIQKIELNINNIESSIQKIELDINNIESSIQKTDLNNSKIWRASWKFAWWVCLRDLNTDIFIK